MDAYGARQWDVFCRVIDNHGDLGVCLRLARHLVALGESVRLWVDDASALQWMAVAPHERDWVHPWPQGHWAPQPAHQVILETFGCHLPEGVEAQLALAPPTAWLNLEYLSAENWVERVHGLPSPVMSGPARGLSKRFCYPGFTAATGGLLKATPAGEATPTAHWPPGVPRPNPPVRCVSLFCYPHAPLAALLQRLADRDTVVFALGGEALQAEVAAARQRLPSEAQQRVRVQALPWLNQADYDALLRGCDVNVVRGEDSFIRAQWAAKPWLWHIYRQDDGSHATKLDAFLDRWTAGLPDDTASQWRQAWRAWNGLSDPAAWLTDANDGLEEQGLHHAQAWAQRLGHGPDLARTLWTWARVNT